MVIRQYHSAILAREYYFRLGGAQSGSERRMATAIRRDEPIIELPLLEAIVAVSWRAVGGESRTSSTGRTSTTSSAGRHRTSS